MRAVLPCSLVTRPGPVFDTASDQKLELGRPGNKAITMQLKSLWNRIALTEPHKLCAMGGKK